jgi:twinkle protein
MTIHPLGAIGEQFIEGRGISGETAVRYGVFTAKREDSGAVVADIKGNVVAFPFFERGLVVAEKYRARGKKFWQRTGGRRTFWNADALDDPGLESGAQALIITEGEIDALTAIDCGFPLSVSVPDGAPPVPIGKAPDDLDPEDKTVEATGKFEFVWNNRDRLKRVKRFIIAVDADPPGQRLAAELVRRLGAGRCLFVTYPPAAVVPTEDGLSRPCKDLNEVLMRFGRDDVTRVLNEAKPYPVRGLYRLSEYPNLPPLDLFDTGWITLDQHLQLFRGGLMVVTGIPSHGKTSWVSNMLVNLAERYGWRSAVCSPEMPVVPQYRDKLRAMRLRRQPADRVDSENADAFLEQSFYFIDASPLDDLGEEITLNWVLERATDAVLRDGIDVLVIDPWNELEHERKREESSSEYIGRAIRVIKRWAKRHNVLVIIVAHPTKDVQDKGKGRMPTPYDVDGAAHWYNKPDHVVIVHRENEEINETTIRIAKVRFEKTGEKGHVKLKFDRHTGRFEMLDHVHGDGGFL